MVCARAEWVQQFLEGRLQDTLLAEMEAHVETCDECFLRVAAGAADLPDADQTLRSGVSATSRLSAGLSASLADTTLQSGEGSTGPVWSRKAIGPYLVTGLLGMGGMSVVHRAVHERTGLEVAVKTVKMPFVASSLAMLRQEIEFLREAKHHAIVTVLDSDLMADDPWYAMELFEEPSLQEFNRRLWNAEDATAMPAEPPPGLRRAAGGKLPEVLRLFARLCDPVAFLHAAGMVHGDIKPSNVFLRSHHQPVLMDFGLAARAKGTIGRETLDVTGRIRGTLPYIAPEIIRGKLPDARADLYAIGCMLYESIVGVPPFASRSGTRIIDMHLSVAPQPAGERVRDVPEKLDELLRRLLAKNPAERFGHASALAASLAALADALSSADGRSSAIISSERATPLFRPPLVGREKELDAILHSVNRARRESAGGLILLVGESGIGKTFLTAEVAQLALLEGVEVITSECLPSTPTRSSDALSAAPLQGFRRFFEMLRDRCSERGPGEVDRLFGERLALLTEYLPALRWLDRRAAGAPAPSLPASAARERIVQAVLDTLAAYTAERPLLLALDDLQWADDLTMAVLERLNEDLTGAGPLLVLGTYRSDEASAPIRRLAARSSTTLLQLGRLGKPDTGAIVSGMLSMTVAPESLTDYVHAHAEGVPFFAAEYLRALVAAGALVYRGGAWSLRPSDQEPSPWLGGALPRTLHELIRDRLDRLAGEVVAALEAGAVLGRRFSLARLARMVERPVSELAPLLASSSAAEITRNEGFDEISFVHDKIRETLYGSLSGDRRVHLHLAAARALDDGPSTPPDQLGPIGLHLKNGADIAAAIEYLEKAGRHALNMAANGDADRFFREVIELEGTLAVREPALRRARWQRERADALQGLGMMAECAECLKASAALLGRPFPSSKAALGGRLTGEVVRQLGHRLWPRLVRRPAPDRIEWNGEMVRVFERMHETAFYLGKDGDLVLSTTASLNASERAGDSPHLTVAYANAAMMAGVLPLPKLAERYFRLAGASDRACPDPEARAWLVHMEGAYRTWLGDRPRALACFDVCIEHWRNTGFVRRLDEAECMRTGLDIFAGMHAQAQARLDVVEARGKKRRDLQIQCWTTLQRAEVHAIRGEDDAVLEQVARTRSFGAAVSRPERIWSMAFECYVLQRRGEHDAAFSLLGEALALIAKGPPLHSHCVTSYNRLAETAVALATQEPRGKQRRIYQAAAARAFSVVTRASRIFPIATPTAALSRGFLDLARGRDPRSVLKRWQRAMGTAARLALPLPELRLRLATLSLLDKSAPERAQHQGRARELIGTLELKPYAAAPLSAGLDGLRGGVKVEPELELSS